MIRAAAAAAILVSGLGSVGCVNTGTCGSGSGCGTGGCGTGAGGHGGGALCANGGPIEACYRNFVDPCYPERYNHAARQAVIAPFAQQVHNGHVLNQSVWNYYFELGTDVLTPAGQEKLISLARVRPIPDPKVYIQTARDLPATLDPAKAPDVRADLDVKRAAAVQRFLASQPAFGAPIAYEIYVHDSPTPGIIADMAANGYRGSILGYRGGISGAAGIGALGTGGSTNLTVAPVINNGGR
jgi:hypothetical protein